MDAAKKANIHEFILSLPDGYDSFVEREEPVCRVDRSRGFRLQEFFWKNPPILILDEATKALDNESERWNNITLFIVYQRSVMQMRFCRCMGIRNW